MQFYLHCLQAVYKDNHILVMVGPNFKLTETTHHHNLKAHFQLSPGRSHKS